MYIHTINRKFITILVTEHHVIITQTTNMRNYFSKYNSKYALKKTPGRFAIIWFFCSLSRKSGLKMFLPVHVKAPVATDLSRKNR